MKFLKGIWVLVKTIALLCLLFLASYTILEKIVPSLSYGDNFITIIVDIAKSIYLSMRALIGV